MSASRLDAIVKGAPSTNVLEAPVSTTDVSSTISQDLKEQSSVAANPDVSKSSEPQIYMNLLILEESLRAQYIALRDRRRQNVFFVLLLTLWNLNFGYLLFLRPREDGSGVGGSVYWVVETAEKMALMGGVVTGILFWGTGQWERGVRWPRRWVAVANRGLKVINAKIVVLKGPWWRELIAHLIFLFPLEILLGLLRSPLPHSQRSGPPHAMSGAPEEDLAPGGHFIKVLLLPKPFSPSFREKWENYRSIYWEQENERRARLRQIYRDRERELARRKTGWLGWLDLRSWHTRNSSSFEETADSRGHVERAPRRKLQESRSSSASAIERDDRAGSVKSRRGNQTERKRRSKAGARTVGTR